MFLNSNVAIIFIIDIKMLKNLSLRVSFSNVHQFLYLEVSLILLINRFFMLYNRIEVNDGP